MGSSRELAAGDARPRLDHAVHVALLQRVIRNFAPVEAAISGRSSGPMTMEVALELALSTGVVVHVEHVGSSQWVTHSDEKVTSTVEMSGKPSAPVVIDVWLPS